MKGIKRAGVLFLVLASLIGIGVAIPSYSQAQVLTREQILAQIQVLMQQIQYLQQQLNYLNQGYNYGNNYGSCYTFNYNFGLSSSGPDVSALQNVLQSSGYSVSYTETASSYFGASTRSAVMAFQQSFGIPSTGFVGPLTRNKLNQLGQQNCYGNNYNPYNPNYCSQTYPYTCNCTTYPYNCNNPTYGILNVTSPTGGQTYQAGSSVYVAWNYSNYNYSYQTQNYTVELWQDGNFITRMTAGSANSMTFNLPSNLTYASNYFFKVYDQNNQSISGTSQNFTVGYSYGSGVTILGPNGGEQVRLSVSYPIQFTVNTNQSAYRVRIELWQNGYFLGVITDGLPVYQSQTQTYSWTGGTYSDSPSGVSHVAPVGYGYKVRVSVYDSSGQLITSDDSNSPFSLTN